jgi:tetratricopeptide (TPR) repeat protein
MFRLPWIVMMIIVGSAPWARAQDSPVLSTVPTQAVYEFQLNYELPWQRWYGGPGLSLGGTMPTQGAFGYSSLNGIPLPAPLGAGVYVNTPAPQTAFPPVPPPGMNPRGLLGPVGTFGPMTAFGPGGFPMNPGMIAPGMGPGIGAPVPPVPGPQGASFTTPAQGMRSPVVTNPQNVRRARREPESSPAARRASLEQQNHGDTLLRQQRWSQAYVHYRNAADLAPERPEGHFRLGLAFTAMRQYASAIRAFKRSLDLDPTLPQSGETLATIFGAEHAVVRGVLLPVVAEWTREDLKDADRLLVLGLLLHFDEDPRGSELLEAALRTTGGNDYILSFVTPSKGQGTRRPAARSNPSGVPGLDPTRQGQPQLELPPEPLPPLMPADPSPEPPPT